MLMDIVMKKQVSINYAIEELLGDLNQPVLTDYGLGIFIYSLYQTKTYKGKPINLKLNVPGRREYNKILNQLLDSNILKEFKYIPYTYSIFGKKVTAEEEVVCSVDPFSYISHLSAMEYHGITDRISRAIIYSSPEPKSWRNFAKKKMQLEYGDINDLELPHLTLKKIKKFGKKNISRYSSFHLGAYVAASERCFRVSSIGRTFLDMIRKPDLCGGINNVLDAYQEFGGQYSNLIIDEIDRHGTKIDKVRAGYIFEVICGLEHEKFGEWEKYAQRGGSRKLDPNNDYWPKYSEKWCLSVNVEI